MSDPIRFDFPSTGFGTTITILSYLASLTRSTILDVDSEHGLAQDVKRIFAIPDSKIQFNPVSRALDPAAQRGFEDHSKVFASYVRYPQIKPASPKPYIALALGDNTETFRKIIDGRNDQLIWPEKYPFEFETVRHIMRVCYAAGYDVMFFSSTQSNLEQKIDLLTKYCDALICYEGGAAHLAHCLDMPTIMLPWNDSCNYVHNYIPNFEQATVPMRIHLDKRTWFLSTPNEMDTWTADMLVTKIQQLRESKGNNVFLTPEFVEYANTLGRQDLLETFVFPEGAKFALEYTHPIGGYA